MNRFLTILAAVLVAFSATALVPQLLSENHAMLRVDAKLPKGANLIMQVHDSLIVECDESDKDEVAKILKETMESVAPELNIKLAVEVTSGANWGEL